MSDRRDDDDFDDYPLPRNPSGNRIPLLVSIGAIGVVAVAFLWFGARQRATEQERHEAEAAEAAERLMQMHREAWGPVNEEPFVTPGENWHKVIGTWKRQPTGPGDTTHPLTFDFQQSMRAQVIWLLPNNGTLARNFHLGILEDTRDQLRIRSQSRNPQMIFQFTLVSDRTIVLNGSGLVFSRQ